MADDRSLTEAPEVQTAKAAAESVLASGTLKTTLEVLEPMPSYQAAIDHSTAVWGQDNANKFAEGVTLHGPAGGS